MVWSAIASSAGNAIGSIAGGLVQRSASKAQTRYQKDFAQKGIQWRVADAKKAGIHPLAALGAQVPSYTPQAVGDLGLSAAGQDIGRAVSAGMNGQQRQQRRLGQLAVERSELENELLRSQIAKERTAPPALPSATGTGAFQGQGDAVNIVPQEYSASGGRPSRDAGASPDISFARTDRGGYTVLPSKDAKERMEDMLVPEIMWSLRNQLIPAISGLTPPDPKEYPLPKGYKYWAWNPLKQEFEPSNKPHNAYNRAIMKMQRLFRK